MTCCTCREVTCDDPAAVQYPQLLGDPTCVIHGTRDPIVALLDAAETPLPRTRTD